MLKILLVDNYPIALSGLHHFLDSAFDEVAIITASDIFTFTDSYEGPVPDVIILGNNGPTVEISLRAIKHCTTSYSNVPLIIYDHDIRDSNISLFLHFGVKGYILKENPVNEITKCIEQVLSGQFYLASEVLNLLLFGDQGRKRITENEPIRLTDRESEIASHLIEGTGTLSIASKLNLKPSTISTMKKRIFTKMKVNNIIQLQKAMDSTS